MDIDRSILKALYYDYPVSTLVQLLDSQRMDMQHDVFLDILPQLLQWSKPEYTYTETNLMRIGTGGEWQANDDAKCKLPTIYHPLDILPHITKKLLIIEKDNPVVRFEQLFRWKDAAMYVGEDLLTTAFMAYEDITQHRSNRTLFVWDDILRHDNPRINEVLDQGLTDLHAHFNATSDVFAFNWISMMNNIQQRKMFDEKLSRTQEVELMTPQTDYYGEIKQMSVAAAYLRFVFYVLLMNQQESNKKSIEYCFQRKVINILSDPWYANDFAIDLQTAINWATDYSQRTANDKPVDYCIKRQYDLDDLIFNHTHANIIYQGERQLLYTFFYRYYCKDPQCVSVAPYMYLYLLIKNKIRREFVQINKIKGFENFETYQDRKDILIPYGSPLIDYYTYCAVNSSTQNINVDHIEARVTPKGLKEVKDPYKPIFAEKYAEQNTPTNVNEVLSIVVHFIKNGKYESEFPTLYNQVGFIKDGTRDNSYRAKIREQMNIVLHSKKPIVGIDAASREIFCRPETFGHVFRYARLKGIKGFTYHAGEDFLDIVDGLRSIDEAILFLSLGDRCRIGHGMALGIDAADYYERRHYTTIVTQQYLLDQCVWLLMRSKELNVTLAPNIETLLFDKAEECYNVIGYKLKPFNPKTYWHSMLLRGNDPEYIHSVIGSIMSDWEMTANVQDARVNIAIGDANAKNLYYDYYFETETIKKGMKLIPHKWPHEIVEIVSEMQKQMRGFVAEKHIGIECCPTSNLKIGYIDRYDQHPLLTKFYPIDKVNSDPSYPLIKSSINTDDRGVFHTSVYEEYSLMALALEKSVDNNNKRKYNEPTVLRYIEEIRRNAQQMAFRNYTDNK